MVEEAVQESPTLWIPFPIPHPQLLHASPPSEQKWRMSHWGGSAQDGLLVVRWSGLGWVHTTQGQKKLLFWDIFLARADCGRGLGVWEPSVSCFS